MVDRHVDIRAPQGDDLWSNIWHPFRQIGHQVANLFAPNSEASGEDGQYTINVELPGVKQGDIDISVRNDMLVISGEKRDARTEEGEEAEAQLPRLPGGGKGLNTVQVGTGGAASQQQQRDNVSPFNP